MSNKKILFMANGYGPFDVSKNFFQLFFNVLKNVKICSRDNLFSPIFLKEVYLKDDIKILADDLLFLNKNIFSNISESADNQSEKYVILEFYYPLSYLSKNKKKIIKFANHLWEKYKLKILFLPFGPQYRGEYYSEAINFF